MLDLVHSKDESGRGSEASAGPASQEVECPEVTLRNLCSRPRPNGHVIVFANEKGGVGKSTLAFHCSIALCDAGARVAVVDLDRRQQSLARAVERRNTTARCLQVDLPTPRHIVLRHQCGAQLSQEIQRIASDCHFVVIDVAGHDSAIARYAIAMADTLVTPLNSSCFDLDLLGRFDPVSGDIVASGHFAELVNALGDERENRGMARADWIVSMNRVRTAEKRQQARILGSLRELAPREGFRISRGLSERVIYRELLPYGLTHMDLNRIPGLGRQQASASEEIIRLIGDLKLASAQTDQAPIKPAPRAKVCSELADNFSEALHAYTHPDLRLVARSA